MAVEAAVAAVDPSDIRGSEPHNRNPSGTTRIRLEGLLHNIELRKKGNTGKSRLCRRQEVNHDFFVRRLPVVIEKMEK